VNYTDTPQLRGKTYTTRVVDRTWRTRATRCITTIVLQTKADAQRDKFATEPSWQRLRRDGRRFRVIASDLSKVANFSLYLVPPLGWSVWVLPSSSASKKLHTLWAIVWRCLRDPTFSRFSRTPTCYRETGRQTGRQTQDYGIYRASMASRGKNVGYYPDVHAVRKITRRAHVRRKSKNPRDEIWHSVVTPPIANTWHNYQFPIQRWHFTLHSLVAFPFIHTVK